MKHPTFVDEVSWTIETILSHTHTIHKGLIVYT